MFSQISILMIVKTFDRSEFWYRMCSLNIVVSIWNVDVVDGNNV